MLEQIAEVIDDFIVGYQRNSENFAEDTDFRRVLFSSLYRHFELMGLRYEIDKSAFKIEYGTKRKNISLTPVKTAYPSASPFDIAVLDVAHVIPVEAQENSNNYKGYWSQPVSVGINIHFCKADQDSVKYLKKLDQDLKKFRDYSERCHSEIEFCGLSLLFVEGQIALGSHIQPGIDALHPTEQAWIVSENGEFLYN